MTLICHPLQEKYAIPSMYSQVAQLIKTLPAVQETWARSLGQEDPQDRGEWQVHGVARVGHDWVTKHHQKKELNSEVIQDGSRKKSCYMWRKLKRQKWRQGLSGWWESTEWHHKRTRTLQDRLQDGQVLEYGMWCGGKREHKDKLEGLKYAKEFGFFRPHSEQSNMWQVLREDNAGHSLERGLEKREISNGVRGNQNERLFGKERERFVLWTKLCSPTHKFQAAVLTLSVMVFGGGAFGN